MNFVTAPAVIGMCEYSVRWNEQNKACTWQQAELAMFLGMAIQTNSAVVPGDAARRELHARRENLSPVQSTMLCVKFQE